MRHPRLIGIAATVALLVIGGLVSAVRAQPAATPARYITDDAGRALILRGFNTASSAKSTADAMPELDESDVEREYRDMGTNFVRFLIQWRAVEPEPGEYDTDYLAKVAERVSWYEKRGYHVLLDMHQDLYGSGITATGDAGNGAPEWATELDGLPVAPQEQWEFYYVQPGVVRAFDNFWGTTGSSRLRDRYVAAWAAVAEYFADDEAVLGYDLMNEPWGGSVQGAAFETGPLARLYQDTIDAIRRVDTGNWIFVEPQAVGVNWGLPSSLPKLNDPRDGADRIVFAPHLYPLPMDLGSDYATAESAVDEALAGWTDNVTRVARRLDAPVVLGEFGLDATRPGALDFVDTVADLADDTGMGWAYWSRDPGPWGPYDADGEATKLNHTLDRPYPRAIAGTPLDIDAEANRLTVSYRSDPGIAAPTEIYLPAAFGDGGEVSCGGCDTDWDAERRILSVDTGATDGEVTVTVRAELRYRRNPFAHREIRPAARHRLANLHPWTPT